MKQSIVKGQIYGFSFCVDVNTSRIFFFILQENQCGNSSHTIINHKYVRRACALVSQLFLYQKHMFAIYIQCGPAIINQNNILYLIKINPLDKIVQNN